MRYADKVVIITGGSKGIGEGCVRVFVEAGSKVVFCARGESEGTTLAAELNERGPGEAYFIRCDVSKAEEIQNLIDAAVARYGRIDCLINNAGWHPELDLGPGDVSVLPSGHDAWVTGDEPVVLVEWYGASNYAKR